MIKLAAGVVITNGKAMANHPCQCAKKTVMTKKEKMIVPKFNGETPRPECDSTATGKEQEKESGAARCNEETGIKPKGRLESDRTRGQRLNLSCKQKMKIGTWNVR